MTGSDIDRLVEKIDELIRELKKMKPAVRVEGGGVVIVARTDELAALAAKAGGEDA